MKTTCDRIVEAINGAYPEINKKMGIEDRRKVVEKHLTEQGLTFSFVGDKPARGAAFCIIPLRGKYRVNIRCGYSRYNYAPCIEILNED